jgi:hypothetical protein
MYLFFEIRFWCFGFFLMVYKAFEGQLGKVRYELGIG